jgi:hypothetical protein
MIRTRLFAAVAASALSLLITNKSHGQWSVSFNPVVGASDRYITGSYWDPMTGRYVLQTDQQVVHASATDPLRNDVLPGSVRYVDYYERDWAGRLIHVTGWQWLSVNGAPHSTLTRTVNQYSGYVVGYTPGGFVTGPVIQQQTTTHYYKMAKAK